VETGRYLLIRYDYPEDVVERRAPFREAHLTLLRAAKERGFVVAGGAVDDPPTGGVIVVRDDLEAAEALVASDPYVVNGVVRAWRISPWNVVV
jgi:uncharacterized protein